MKKLLLLLPLACCAFYSLGKVEWTLHDKPIVEFNFGHNPLVQFGLRDDGVVVWRKLTSLTNSPAEPPVTQTRRDPTYYPHYYTLTNDIIEWNTK